MTGMGSPEAAPRCPEDIGDLQRGAHGSSAVAWRLLPDERCDLVERTGDGPHCPCRHLGVERRVIELGVAQQDLDHADIDAILEQMRRETVPVMSRST